jgi:polar amino acid transport system substrate-binding protein
MHRPTSRRQAITVLLALNALNTGHAALACEQPLELLRVLQPSAKAEVGRPSIAALLEQHIEEQAHALGCEVKGVDVPRARQLQLYLNGKTDFLYPANRAADRDAAGQFAPMYRTRPMLLSRQPLPAAVRDAASLQASRLRIVSVRGVDYGGATQALQRQLSAQKRWLWEAEVPGLLRAVRDGLADTALISPVLLIGIPEIHQQWHWQALPELEWRDIGVYLSNRMPVVLRARLQERLQTSHKALRERVQRYAAPELLSPQYIEFL